MPETSTHKAELILDNRSLLGEGPVWDERNQTLYWVDIEGKKLHGYRPGHKEYTNWSFDVMIGAAVPTEKGSLILALEDGLAEFDRDSASPRYLNVLENHDPRMRLNDGKTDLTAIFILAVCTKNLCPKAGPCFGSTKT